MTQNLFASLILGAAILACGYLVNTHTSLISTASAVKTLQVNADGKVKIVPDTVVISAGVEIHTRQTQALAYTDMNTSINALKSVLTTAGIAEKNIQTSWLSVGPEYNYIDGKQILSGYQAITNLSIRVEKKDPKVTNDILDAISKIPDIRMNGVEYDLADKEIVYTEARKIALEKARKKAEEMAQVTHVTIIAVQSISENTGVGAIPLYQNAKSLDMAAGGSTSSTDISVGQVEYTSSVNVSYEIR